MTVGNIVQISQSSLRNDIEHELIHVEQAQRVPFFHPILYMIETLRHGYRNNKYEVEAYMVGNHYIH